MITAAVLGASGYAGGELIRFLDGHPSMDLIYLGAHSKAGQTLGEVHPHLGGADRTLGTLSSERASAADVVFLALPHGASASPAMEVVAMGTKVVDLGSDFRLDTSTRYVEAYGSPHPFPDQLGTWAYGIPELFRPAIEGASNVAAPGCYPTAALLGIVPLVAAGLVDTSDIIVDAMSGVSGAGRGVTEALQFGSIDESVKAYKVLEHRHRPEIERGIDALGGDASRVLFTPHLVPMQRGILSTAHLNTHAGVHLVDLHDAIDEAYAGSTFVRRIDQSPETRWVVGSNNALITVYLDQRSGRTVVIAAIDNLVKGAAGQAIQCANVMFGLDEGSGLPTTGWMP
jgi:N-acetyl-gamma-glutamyl-phosphate reductase